MTTQMDLARQTKLNVIHNTVSAICHLRDKHYSGPMSDERVRDLEQIVKDEYVSQGDGCLALIESVFAKPLREVIDDVWSHDVASAVKWAVDELPDDSADSDMSSGSECKRLARTYGTAESDDGE